MMVWLLPALSPRGRPTDAPRPPRRWLDLGLLGVADAGNYILYFAAVDRGPLALAGLTHYAAPVLVALAAPTFLGERRRPRTLTASAAALVGLGLLLSGSSMRGPALITAACGFGSAIFYAANTVLSKQTFQHFSAAEFQQTGIDDCFAGIRAFCRTQNEWSAAAERLAHERHRILDHAA